MSRSYFAPLVGTTREAAADSAMVTWPPAALVTVQVKAVATVPPGIWRIWAVRTTSNASAYHIWSSTTVSTVTVSGDVYYAITVTASEDDLLTAQANNLLAGSNAAQSLLGEIQWTTTRGTFSSDTFTINVPSEVVREPDV